MKLSKVANHVPARSVSRVSAPFKKRRLRHPGPVEMVNRIANVLPLILCIQVAECSRFPFRQSYNENKREREIMKLGVAFFVRVFLGGIFFCSF